jgi:glucose-6-phosphate dehydrogenase assembly protein OpcA
MPFPKLRRNTSNQTTRRANTLSLGDDRADKIASRIQNTRTTRFETDFKTLIKKLGDREKIVTQRLDKRNMLKSHRLTHLNRAH